MLALDSETFLMFPGVKAPPLVCVTWADSNGKTGLIHCNDLTVTKCRTWLLGSTVYANAPFDLAVFANRWPELLPYIFEALDEDRIHDVLLREKLLDLARGTFRFEEDEEGNIKKKGYSLAAVAQRRLGVFLDKDTWRLRYHDLYDLPVDAWPEGAKQYATSDAETTLKVFEAQEPLAKYLKNEAAQNRAAWALHLMHCHGFRTDSAAVDRLEKAASRIVDRARGILQAEGLVRGDGTRNLKAAIRRMIDVSPELRFTDKGEEKLHEIGRDKLIELAKDKGKFVSVNEEACLSSGDPVLATYATYTKFNNLLTGSVKHFRRGTVVPIQSRFEVLMETGRTSSSGPNIQNLRRKMKVPDTKEELSVRECFVSRPGHVLIACDYSAAELHTLAQYCYDQFGYSKLGDALNEGIDVHAKLGAQMIGEDYDRFMARLKDEDPEAQQARQLAKAGNFGFPGGCSSARFVGFAAGYGVEIDVREGAKLRAQWFSSWPEMQDLFDHINKDCCVDDQWYGVYLPRSSRLRFRCTYTAACNTTFQGPASDGAKAALYALTKAQRLGRLPGRCVNFIHDEIIVEAPEDTAHETAMAMQRIMETEFNHFVPDCPTTAEPTIMRRWSKKAKQVWKNGKLSVWEDLDARANG